MEGEMQKEIVITGADFLSFMDGAKNQLKDRKSWPEVPMLLIIDELRTHLVRKGVSPNFRVEL